MRPPVAAFACAAALAAAAPSRAQWLPPGSDECIAEIERSTRAGARADEPLLLGDVCPRVAALLNETGFADLLLEQDAAYLQTERFAALAALAPAYDSPRARGDLSLDALDGVLADVRVQIPPPELSLWERISQWLDEWLGRRGDVDTRWLEEWLENLSVPERWLRYVVIALGALLVIATGAIVANELRAAGVFAGRRVRERFGGDGPGALERVPAPLDLDAVRGAPLARQPALLLALVLARLRGRTPIGASLTHRELLAAGRDAVPADQHVAFATVVRAAERTTFGGWQPGAAELAPVLASGAAVLDGLAQQDTEHRAQ